MQRCIVRVRVLALALLLLLLTGTAQAHALAPSLLRIQQLDRHSAQLTWKESALRPAGSQVAPAFGEQCHKQTEPALQIEKSALIYRWQITCDNGIARQPVTITGLEQTRGTALVEYRNSAGQSTSALLSHDDNRFVIPRTLHAGRTSMLYLQAGIGHLLSGWDHVLFVSGLFLLLLHQPRQLLLAVTAFSVGHSLTLALVSTGQLAIDARWAEVLIAASITLLGIELLDNGKQPSRGLIRRAPYLLTFVFGLVHGCGFASVLAQTLSQQTNLLLPLVAFNLGIEIGQCLILAGLGIAVWGIQRRFNQALAPLKLTAAYTLGALSVCWLLQHLII